MRQVASLFLDKGIRRFIRGIGGIWASDAQFGGVLQQNLVHARIIVCLDIDPALVAQVFRLVLRKRNPEAAVTLKSEVIPSQPVGKLHARPCSTAPVEQATLLATEAFHLAAHEEAILRDIECLQRLQLQPQKRRAILAAAQQVSGINLWSSVV
jgi:hypothetical protein